ncbi:hypothetical protein [Neorhizobium alkalisoli]|jgi:hypothetical protein|uniref:Lectin-like protein BA14k n=1 Tax=Neorhizobium alkalisoli TaxID=528178 RepID=A0A561QWU6_9HYPH|nr:hypothetical protein [Neorhizobium alkalisoli]TWF54802.1 hypothetical protein FHW37_103672 [Neorhizobium alkalisoli]
MSVMQRTVSAGLVALTLGGALAATAPAAEARDYYRHNNVWPGVAAGLAGGIIGGAIIAGATQPVYAAPAYAPGYAYAPPPPPPPVYYRPAYYPAPSCHYEWARNEWGEGYRVRVCPGY